MPLRIEHIDAIARKKKRDVLYLEFHSSASEGDGAEGVLGGNHFAWEQLPIRQEIIDWLEAQGMGWACCGHFADESLMRAYRGQIYIDVPFDASLPEFQALQEYLEFPDGSMRFSEATLFYCPLSKAMENAAHDEPGFWERWAENF